MTPRFGVNPILWSNDDFRELGGDIPLEVCLQQARQAGYEGIELGHKFPRDAPGLTEVLERHGLVLVSGWHSTRLLQRSVAEEIAALQPHMDLLAKSGADVVIVAEISGAVHSDRHTPLSQRPVLDRGGWRRLTAGLDALAGFAGNQRMRLAYHHHMGTVVQTVDEIDRLMDATADLGLLIDTGHLAFAEGAASGRITKSDRRDGALIDVTANHIGRINHVHLKDVRSKILTDALRHDESFGNAVAGGVFTIPGDGCVDYAPLFKALEAADYDGWLVVEAEQDPKQAPPDAYARRGLEAVRGFVAMGDQR